MLASADRRRLLLVAGPGDCLTLLPVVLSALAQLWIDGLILPLAAPCGVLAMGPTARGVLGSCGSLWDAYILCTDGLVVADYGFLVQQPL